MQAGSSEAGNEKQLVVQEIYLLSDIPLETHMSKSTGSAAVFESISLRDTGFISIKGE